MSQILNKQAILDTSIKEFKLSSMNSSDAQNNSGPNAVVPLNTDSNQMIIDSTVIDSTMIDPIDAEPSIFDQQILQDSINCDVFGVNNPQASSEVVQWTTDPTTQDYLRIEFDPNYIGSPELINPDGTINLPLVKVAQLSKYEAHAVVIRLINDIFPQFYNTFGHDAYLRLVCSSPTIVNKLFYKFNDSQSGYYTGTVTNDYIPDGVGKFVEIVSGLEYSGVWKDGFPERHLILSYKGITIYDGGVTRGQLNGYGYYTLYAPLKCLEHKDCNNIERSEGSSDLEETKHDPYSCSKFGCVNYTYADLNIFEHARYHLKDINKKFFRYVGHFRNSYMTGEGEVYCIVKNTTLLDMNVIQKTLYKGGFSRGLYHGHGVEHVMTSKDAGELVFKARYNNGVVVEGLLTHGNKIYYGAFRDHLAHGFGKICRILDGKSCLSHYGIYSYGRLTHLYMLTKQSDGYTGVIKATDKPTDNKLTDNKLTYDKQIDATTSEIIFKGYFNDNISLRAGTYIQNDYYFIGEFKNNYLHGKATVKNNKGDIIMKACYDMGKLIGVELFYDLISGDRYRYIPKEDMHKCEFHNGKTMNGTIVKVQKKLMFIAYTDKKTVLSNDVKLFNNIGILSRC